VSHMFYALNSNSIQAHAAGLVLVHVAEHVSNSVHNARAVDVAACVAPL
jgi:hypothetical protein